MGVPGYNEHDQPPHIEQGQLGPISGPVPVQFGWFSWSFCLWEAHGLMRPPGAIADQNCSMKNCPLSGHSISDDPPENGYRSNKIKQQAKSRLDPNHSVILVPLRDVNMI